MAINIAIFSVLSKKLQDLLIYEETLVLPKAKLWQPAMDKDL